MRFTTCPECCGCGISYGQDCHSCHGSGKREPMPVLPLRDELPKFREVKRYRVFYWQGGHRCSQSFDSPEDAAVYARGRFDSSITVVTVLEGWQGGA